MQLSVIVVVAVVVACISAVSEGRVVKAPPHAAGHSAPPTKGTPLTDTSKKNKNNPFNPCLPHPCYESETIEEKYPLYATRLIKGGTWLKAKQRHFNTSAPEQDLYNEINEHLTGMELSVPAVVKMDLGIDHVKRQEAYFNIIRSLGDRLRVETQNMYSEASRIQIPRNVRNPTDPGADAIVKKFQTLRNRFNSSQVALRDMAKKAYDEYVHHWCATVYSFIHPVYQSDPVTGVLPKTAPKPITNPNLSYVDELDATVYVRGFTQGEFLKLGLMGSLGLSKELAKIVNVTDVSTMYLADYANGFYEVWVPVPGSTKPFTV